MEALSAVSISALTIYDMCKAIQRDIEIADSASISTPVSPTHLVVAIISISKFS